MTSRLGANLKKHYFAQLMPGARITRQTPIPFLNLMFLSFRGRNRSGVASPMTNRALSGKKAKIDRSIGGAARER